MELTDALRIPLDPAVVREALGDLALLRASLEHCESFARQPNGEHALVVTLPVGPLRGRYEIRAYVANRADGSSAGGGEALRRTLNFKASAAGVGSLRGQIDIELEEDALAGERRGPKGSAERDDGGGRATRIQYAIWTTMSGPLAELAPRQVENALRALGDDFFAEFSAVVEAKYGRAPNRARTGPGRRQQVFLRPISLAGLACEPAAQDALEAATRPAGGELAGQRGAQGLDRQAPQVMPAWVWAAAFAAGVALLYVLDRLE